MRLRDLTVSMLHTLLHHVLAQVAARRVSLGMIRLNVARLLALTTQEKEGKQPTVNEPPHSDAPKPENILPLNCR